MRQYELLEGKGKSELETGDTGKEGLAQEGCPVRAVVLPTEREKILELSRLGI